MEDASIIELFFERNGQAIEETDKKYGKLCFSVANNLLNNFHDSQECVSDTYLAAWNKIPPTRPKHYPAFLCKITKNFALKKLEYYTADKRNANLTLSLDELGDCVSDTSSVDSQMSYKELGLAISSFLYKQKERDRVIFIKRYWFCDDISNIAKVMGITQNNVTLILFRMRQNLRKYLTKEGFDL